MPTQTDTHVIAELQQLKALANPLRQQILGSAAGNTT